MILVGVCARANCTVTITNITCNRRKVYGGTFYGFCIDSLVKIGFIGYLFMFVGVRARTYTNTTLPLTLTVKRDAWP